MKSDRNTEFMGHEFGTKVLITDLEADIYLERAKKLSDLKEKPAWPPNKEDK